MILDIFKLRYLNRSVLLLIMTLVFPLTAWGQQKLAPAAAVPSPSAAATPSVPPVTPPANVAQQPAWSVACSARARALPLDCAVEQRVVARETGQVIAVALVSVAGETRKPTLLFQLPSGLFLQDAPVLRIDDAGQISLQYQSCDARGCVILAPVNPALLASMRAGRVMTVQVTGINRDKLTFPFLLTDFSVAFDAAR